MTVNPGTSVTKVLALYARYFGTPDDVTVYRAPGRTVLMGDHLDYNDGLVLAMTLNRGVYFACRPRLDSKVRIYSDHSRSLIELDNSRRPVHRPATWEKYVCGLISLLSDRADVDIGLEGAIWSDVPIGCGLSSSSAFLSSIALAVNDLFRLQMTRHELARQCQIAENKYVGVASGIMDPFVSLHGRNGSALLLDCRDISFEHIPLFDATYVFVVINSRKSRVLGETGFARLTELSDRALRQLKAWDPSIQSLRDVRLTSLHSLGPILPSDILSIVHHNTLENDRTRAAVDAYRRRDYDELGVLMKRSHASLRDNLGVGITETEFLVDISVGLQHVVGSRLTGGGFGGCVLSLVETAKVRDYCSIVATAFQRRFSVTPEFLILTDNVNATRLR